jgi:glycosyltransferase involved in cell wall biosynthesis
MKILFIERSPTTTVSIEKVFRELAKSLVKEGFEIEFQQMPYGNSLLGILKNLLFFKPIKADVYHITGHIHYIGLKLPIEKTVLTIHDMRILYDRKGIRRWIIKHLFFDYPIRRLKYITAISSATKNEIVYQTNSDAEKVILIENPAFQPTSVRNRKEFDQKCPIILQVGTAFHKNIPNLAKAIEGLNCILKIVGKIDETQRVALKNINIENVVDLDDSQLEAEYLNADIVSFCSTYEGFGLPIIEGQIYGKPVITSRLSPMNEVAGDGALLVDPENVAEIRAAVEKVITDENYRNLLVEKGFENIKRFDSSKIAKQYASIYERIVSFNESRIKE